MPELPEVETTRRGLERRVVGKTVVRTVVRQARLRWRVPARLTRELPGQTIRSVTRRGKYLLLNTDRCGVIIHLGMSGSLRYVRGTLPPDKHDHVDLALDDGGCLRLRDPRRFGSVLWSEDPRRHRLLASLGPEPLGPDFDGVYLFERSRARTRAIRDFLLDGRIVAGIGNIYANEALFEAGIRPTRPAGRVPRARCERLARAIRATLRRALRAGGTTLSDFQNAAGRPGHFQLKLKVYGRAGEPCTVCGARIKARRLGQRRVFYCPKCQL
jgi:formamidopyrimidine-DNA glycosylase